MLKNRIYILLMCILMSCVAVSSCSFSKKEDTQQSSEKKSKKKSKKKEDKNKKSIDESDINEDKEDEEEEAVKETLPPKKDSADYDEVKQQLSDEIGDCLSQDKVMFTLTFTEGADSWSWEIIKETHDGADYYYYAPIDDPCGNMRVLVVEDDVLISTDHGGTWTATTGSYGDDTIKTYYQYINYLSFLYAAIENGSDVKLNDGGLNRHVMVINKKEAEKLDTDPVKLGIIDDAAKLKAPLAYEENNQMLKKFDSDNSKTYVFGPINSEFSIMESVRDENGMELYYTIITRVPNEVINDIEMMPLDGLYNGIKNPK